MTLSKILTKYSKNNRHEVTLSVSLYDTPIGKVCAAADDNFLYTVVVEDSKGSEKSFQILSEKLKCNFVENINKILKTLGYEIEAYFRGNLKKFSLPIKTFGSDFQQVSYDQKHYLLLIL